MGGAEIGDSPVIARRTGGTTRLSSKIHKWLALIIGVQMLFWFVSGLFFAAVPIERVRSEHSIRELEPAPIALPLAAQGLARVAAAEAGGADKVELRSLMGRPVALITRGPGSTIWRAGRGCRRSTRRRRRASRRRITRARASRSARRR